jgi:DNA-directed RNA polymerase subunit M/transcription elongation factor TFIIS
MSNLNNNQLVNKDKTPINKAGYPILSNRPMSCPNCANLTNGIVREQQDPRSKEVFRIINWTCPKCGNLFKRGAAA